MDVPAVRIDLAPAVATSSASLEISVGTPIWLHWLRIAKAQTTLARAGADRAPAPAQISVVVEPRPVGTITDEMYPAMVAIMATAHALDGLYDQIRGFAPSRQGKGRPARQRVILEAIKDCFKVGKHWQRWLVELDWLFALRDPAVHPMHKAGPTVVHPSAWGNVAAEYADYSADNAERALKLLEDVLRTCVDNAKPASREWATGTGKAALNDLTS